MPADPVVSSVRIAATPERIFDFFTDPRAIVTWMGDFAILDPRPGGVFSVDINGVPARGRYLELEPPHRLVLSWGHADSDVLPPGASTVEIRLTPDGEGTVVEIVHRNLPDTEAAKHSVGWQHFLRRLAEAAAGREPGPDPWATTPPAR